MQADAGYEYYCSQGRVESPERAVTGARIKQLAGMSEHDRVFVLESGSPSDREIGDDEVVRLDGAPLLVYARPPH